MAVRAAALRAASFDDVVTSEDLLRLANLLGLRPLAKEVARITAQELGGVLIDAKLELPTARAPQGVPTSAIVGELAARLDPRGVLG